MYNYKENSFQRERTYDKKYNKLKTLLTLKYSNCKFI